MRTASTDDDKTPTKKKMPESPSEEQIIMMLPTLDDEFCTMHPTLKEKAPKTTRRKTR